MINERVESALAWCREYKVKTQLSLYDLESERPIVKTRLNKLQKWILSNCENTSITWDDTLSGFYNIEGIELEMYKLKGSILDKKKKRKELKRLSAKLKRIKESVAIAFNQLYLMRLVKRKWNDRWLDIDEQIQDYIAYTRGTVKLSDIEIVSSKWWNKLTGMNDAKGSLVLTGSEMCDHVYPGEIIRKGASF